MDIVKELFNLADKNYKKFNASLIPTVDGALVIGVRVPILRKFALDNFDKIIASGFLDDLPHKYYDENLLHGIVISLIKDYNSCLSLLEKFLPFMDNWAVCDITNPKVFSKNKAHLLPTIKRWIASKKTYTVRFGVKTLMSLYLDGDFKTEFLALPLIKSEEYYINMAISWFYATALAKQWGDTVVYLEKRLLPTWVHNKTIQKAIESYRITNEQKEYLKSLKIK